MMRFRAPGTNMNNEARHKIPVRF